MANFHMHVKTGSRTGGQSAVSTSDYILRAGQYRGDAAEVVATESGHMPGWVEEPRDLWAAADRHERANGRLFVEIRFALPREFREEERIEALRAHAAEVAGAEQLPYTWALHAGLDAEGYDHNPHGHLMVCERGHDGHDRTAETWFRRYKAQDPAAGGARKTTALQSKTWVGEIREWSVGYQNARLAEGGHAARVDHRSLIEQGVVDRHAQIHLGAYSHRLLTGKAVNGREHHTRLQKFQAREILNRDLVGCQEDRDPVPEYEVEAAMISLRQMAETQQEENDVVTLVARHTAMVNYLAGTVSLERATKMVEVEEQYFEEQEAIAEALEEEANPAVMRDPDDMSEREQRVDEKYLEEQEAIAAALEEAAHAAVMRDPDDMSEREYQEREKRVDGPEPRELPPPREPRRYQPPPDRPPPKGAW